MDRNDHYLLTGASGFLGHIINQWLVAEGFKVTGLTRPGEPVRIDISKPFNLGNELNPDVIVHAAGKAHSVPRTPEEEKAFYNVNFEGTINLCQALEKLPVVPKSFIFISTVAVYGIELGEMIPEDHPLNGETPYAKSKIMAEQWLTDWALKNNIKLGILRLPLIAGPNPPGNLGAMISGIRSGKYFSIGKATAKKSIVWQEDIAAILPAIAQIGGIFNLTDGDHPTFKELELVISEKLNRKKPIVIPIYIAKMLAFGGDLLGSRFPINTSKLKKITSTLTFDDKKARSLLGWNPRSVLDKLRETL